MRDGRIAMVQGGIDIRWSSDGGATWSKPIHASDTGSVPCSNHFVELPDDQLLLTTRGYVAPGEPIISTLATNASVSSAIQVGDDHFKLEGTSMSSPHLAGVVALLLERNNTLTIGQVRTALQAGADTSDMTAKTPDPANSYGAGKVNAAQVLGSVAEDTSAYHGGGSTDGGGSSSSCSLVQSAGAGSAFTFSLLLLLALGLRRPGRRS